MKKVVIYVRVSTSEQDYERQINELRVYCANRNFIIVVEFGEKISGGLKNEERQELTNLINYVSLPQNDIHAVVVHELSRLGRSQMQVLKVIEKLTELKINLIISNTAQETLNADGSVNLQGKLMISVLSSFAEMEKSYILERSKSGLLNSAKKGHAGGGIMIPFGYKKDPNKMLVIDAEESKIVEEIYNLSLSGKGTRVIANYLNRNKIKTRLNKLSVEKILKYKTGKKSNKEVRWMGNVILTMLKNPLYKGERKYKNFTIESPVIIQPEIWNKVQANLKENFHKNPRNTKNNFYLKNKIKCGYCQRNYTGKKRINLRDNHYMCSSHILNHVVCENKAINIDKLENIIFSILKNHSLVQTLIKDNTNQDIPRDLSLHQQDLIALNMDLQKLKSKRDKLVDIHLDGDISKEVYKQRLDKINSNEKNILKTIKQNERRVEYLTQRLNNFSTIQSVIENLDSNPLLIEQVFHELIEKIEIYKINSSDAITVLESKIRRVNKADVYYYLELFLLKGKEPIKIICSRYHQLFLILQAEIIFEPHLKTLLIADEFDLNSIAIEKISNFQRL